MPYARCCGGERLPKPGSTSGKFCRLLPVMPMKSYSSLFLMLLGLAALSGSSARGAVAADFNADGKSDIVWQNTVTGQRYLWIMSGATHVTDVDLGVLDTNWSIAN